MNKTLCKAILPLLFLSGCLQPIQPSLEEVLATATNSPLTLTTWEQAFLDASSLPISPVEAYLTAPDGLALAYRDWIPTGWTGTGTMVLFVPGSTSHSGHYSVLGQSLSASGVYTRIIDVRGMGLSVRKSATLLENNFSPRTYLDDSQYYIGRVGDSLDETQIIRDLSLHIVKLKQTFPAARLFLGGHSSGGGIISRYVEANGDYFLNGTILCGPFNYHSRKRSHRSGEVSKGLLKTRPLGSRGLRHPFLSNCLSK